MIQKHDFEISLIIWIASLVAVYWFPQAVYLVIATSINVLVQRAISYNFGDNFTRRVHQTLDDDLKSNDSRLKKMEHDVADVKEAQVNIAGQFRGRGHQ